MSAKKWRPCYMAIFIVLVTVSCMQWGEVDPPAGNQVYPRLERILSFEFNEEKLDPAVFQIFLYDEAETPAIAADAELGRVLSVANGYIRTANPLTATKVQNGVSLTFWYKQPATETGSLDRESAIFSFQDEENHQNLFFTANGWICYQKDGTTLYEDNNPASVQETFVTPGVWHYIAMAITNNGYFICVDGIKRLEKPDIDFDCSQLVEFMASAPFLYIGYGSENRSQDFYLDNFSIYRNTITDKETAVPAVNPSSGQLVPVPDPVYFNCFERGLGEANIVGSGTLEEIGGNFGTVFQNVGGAQRTNYLLLPSDILSHSSGSKELSITVWVNAANAGASSEYQYAPLFTAYGAAPTNNTNTSPMLACQARGVVTVNTNGPDNVGGNWCDYTDAQNDLGMNAQYNNENDWLADHEWHFYTAVFTETTAAVYFDGELKNSWTISGSGEGNTVGSLFGNNGLSYICLGGNQAWNWGDNDAGFMFDGIAVYNTALTEEQIESLAQQK